MCGIVGIYHPEGGLPERDVLKKMVARLVHRGPDETGYFWGDGLALGVVRLAILDVEGGSQPVVDESEDMAVVHNGEIYNFRALRDELLRLGHRFATRSDTEVLLRGYQEWGTACVDRFRGMFASAVWDGRKGELWLLRDRMGIKPLYYAQIPGGAFLFASEIKALLSHPGIARRLYPPALNNLFTYGFNTAPHTFFDGIMQVLPGTWKGVSPAGIVTHKYWDIRLDRPTLSLSEEDVISALRNLIEEAVRYSLVSDVPVGSYLSGGLDSTTVTGMYARLSGGGITSLSILLDGADYEESLYSREASDFFHTRNIEFPCTVTPEEAPALVHHMEEPMATLLALPLFQLSRAAHEAGFKVVLSGDGSDEIFGGYDYFKILKVMDFIDRGRGDCRKTLLGRIFPQIGNPIQARLYHAMLAQTAQGVAHPGLPYRYYGLFPRAGLFSKDYEDRLSNDPGPPLYFLPVPGMAERLILDQALYMETKMRLLNLTLPLADKMGMAHSVELRPPFLDHDLVDFVFQIPPRLKMKGLNEKYILKESMKGLVPASICERKKQPLQPPGPEFLRKLLPFVLEMLSPRAIARKGYFSPPYVQGILREYLEGGRIDQAGLLITVFFVQLWDEVFFGR